MQYLFSQWKGKQWKEKMKIFRKETNQIRWNASRNASLGRKGQDWQASLHMWQHMSHITACPLPKMLPPPLTPLIVKHNFRGNPQLTETDKDPIKLGLQFKGFLLVCKMTILWLFLFPAFLFPFDVFVLWGCQGLGIPLSLLGEELISTQILRGQ